MSLISQNLFDKVLVQPFNEGADKLLIVSGYATANMVARHADFIKKVSRRTVDIDLIVGMGVQDGLELKNHRAFHQLQNSEDLKFKCDYIINRPPVHSKVYIWLKNTQPYKSFIGSANYTQNAFSHSMRETLTLADPISCSEYFNSLIGETMNCGVEEDTIKNYIDLYERKRVILDFKPEEDQQNNDEHSYRDLSKVTLPLIDNSGNVPARSGLNWGQRPEYNRNPNQAYINIPMHIARSGIFPEVGEVFTIETDDEKQLICVRAQQGGKGLHTTLNNSLMGEYFRYRLGLRSGEFITTEHLLRYGRTDVDIYKIDTESYYMDFSV